MIYSDYFLELGFEVEYDYVPGYKGSFDEPPSEADVEITNVYLRHPTTLVKIDILKYLTDEVIEQIQEDILLEAPYLNIGVHHEHE